MSLVCLCFDSLLKRTVVIKRVNLDLRCVGVTSILVDDIKHERLCVFHLRNVFTNLKSNINFRQMRRSYRFYFFNRYLG